MASELSRLDDLLQAAVAVPHEPLAAPYEVEPVLDGLVALRRASGLDIDLAVEPGLRAIGSPATLAQVVTNLIGNAERHAPGSPVRITAVGRIQRITVEVRDFGPGIAPGREDVVFERGVRDRLRGGRGLGLHVCRRMLVAENGSIAFRPRELTTPGCAVLLELPSSGEPATPRSIPGSLRCSAS